MSTVAISGFDTVIIAGRNIVDFANGDNATLTFPNDLFSVATGKSGNSIYAFNETGRQCDVGLRLIRGSADDKYFNGLMRIMMNDAASFVLMGGTFVKRIGNGFGFIHSDTYQLTGGVFTKQVEVKSNSEGDVDQSVAIYTLKFTNSPRAIF